MEEPEKLVDAWIKESIEEESKALPSKNFTLQVMQQVIQQQRKKERNKTFWLFGIVSFIVATLFIVISIAGLPLNTLQFLSDTFYAVLSNDRTLPIAVGVAIYLIIGRVLIAALLTQKLVVKFKPL